MTVQLARSDLTRCSPLTNVIDKPKKLRIAIGVFDRIEKVDAALSQLSAGEIPESSIVLLCTSETAESEGNGNCGSAQVSAVAKSTALFIREGDRVVRANSGPDPGEPVPVEKIVRFEQWIEPRLAARLDSELSAAACLLFGIAATPDEERTICDVLIKNSLGQVQVHDFPVGATA